jgi:hypothetical protein
MPLVLGGVALVVLTVAAGAANQAQPTHKWKFPPTITAPWVAEGEEEGEFEPPDAAAGLCRSAPFNTTAVYAPLAPNVDAIVGDPVNNSGFSNFGCTTPQNETTIAVNPTNPQNLVAGANDYRVCCDFTGLNDATGGAYYSFDGGAHWGNVQLPGLTFQTDADANLKRIDAAGDPVVAFGADGTVYYANIVFSRVSPVSGVVVSTSHDGGRSWSDPNVVTFTGAGNFIHDKEWIAAGPDGKVVVTWTRFNLGPRGAGFLESPIVGAFSKDGGKTWNRQSFPISDGAHPFDQGSQVAYGPDGALYVAYEAASPTTGYRTDALVLARSTNDGLTFETKELARVYDDPDCYPIFAGSQTLSDMHFRLNSYPSLSIDPSNATIAIAWSDDQGGGTCGSGGTTFSGTTSNQVKLVRGTWATIGSAPVVPVTTSAPDKVFPSVAARGGKLAVTYYTRDYAIGSAAAICHVRTNDNPTQIPPTPSANSVCIDYAAKSATSTGSFGSEVRLSSESSNPYVQFADGSFIGDYSQVAIASNGTAYGAWTDFRGNPGVTPANQDVVVQSFTP